MFTFAQRQAYATEFICQHFFAAQTKSIKFNFLQKMGDNIAELMVVLKCLIKNTAQDKIQLKELIKIYQKQECENLEIVAERNGFVSVLEMISSFSEFKITKNGLQTFVQIVKKAPTTEMNKQSR